MLPLSKGVGLRVKLLRLVAHVSAFSCLIVCSFTSVAADSITFHGVSFRVESREELEDGSVKVVIDGRPFLLPRANLERAVASTYLSASALIAHLAPDALMTLLAQAIREKDTDMAERVIVASLRSPSISPEAFGVFVRAVGGLEGGREIISAVLSAAPSGVQDQAFCLSLSQVPAASVGKALVSVRSSSFRTFCSALLKNDARALFQRGDYRQVLSSIEVLIALGDGDVPEVKEATAALAILRQFERSLLEREQLGVVEAIGKLRSDSFFAPVSRLALPVVVTHAVGEALQRKNPVFALFLLSQLDFIARTPHHHTLMSEAIGSLTVEDAVFLSREPIAEAVNKFSSKDEAIHAEVVRYLDISVQALTDAGEVEKAMSLLSLLASYRPDPSRENDALRRACGEALLKKGKSTEARTVFKQIETGFLDWFTIRLFAQGQLGPLAIGAVLIAFGSSVFWGLGRLRAMMRGGMGRQSYSGESSAKLRKHERDQTKDFDVKKKFVAYPSEYRTSDTRGEYESLLEFFELPADADLHLIKLAYRNLVKEAHPDRLPHQEARQADSFIKITERYDRLLALYAERSGQKN